VPLYDELRLQKLKEGRPRMRIDEARLDALGRTHDVEVLSSLECTKVKHEMQETE
jgi:hypothetical protein